jgi:hypothetical protein
MKITATNGGGFAGITRTHEVDTETSPAGSAIEAALASADFFASPAEPEPIGADLPRWTIVVDADGRRGPASARWKPLLDHILTA